MLRSPTAYDHQPLEPIVQWRFKASICPRARPIAAAPRELPATYVRMVTHALRRES
ncbi:hypothetical protein [Streptosporangium sp. LJ11]|uniref:hypothetical protein n=1 Tax=Streptosporangium sp. LJ11 TaxID=3436927 RepID=UPI003F7AEB61